MLLGRYFLALYTPDESLNVLSQINDVRGTTAVEGSCRTGEWLRGDQLCTYRGKYHLAWSVPMAPATYWVPAASIHSFLMFSPFFIIKWNMVIQGVFLWLAGPFVAAFITDNLQEQAAIWSVVCLFLFACFFLSHAYLKNP